MDAARGMGLSGAQVIRQVELPLALPLIFGGIKTSTVNVIATATIAPLVGVVTLGDPLVAFSVYGREGQIGASIIVAAAGDRRRGRPLGRPARRHACGHQARARF